MEELWAGASFPKGQRRPALEMPGERQDVVRTTVPPCHSHREGRECPPPASRAVLQEEPRPGRTTEQFVRGSLRQTGAQRDELWVCA